MTRSRDRAIGFVLVAGVAAVFACGGTVTNVGSILVDGGAEAAADARADCSTTQCLDADGGFFCEGDHGFRACPGNQHTEMCTCGGASPSHWVDCQGCP